MLSIIVSVGKNLEIGRKNSIIWHDSKDLVFFKKITKGKRCVVGQRTYQSLPTKNNQKLPERELILISRNKEQEIVDNVIAIFTLDEFKRWYTQNSEEETMIIGGAMIYRELIAYVDKIYLTRFDREEKEADSFFPEIDKEKWILESLKKEEDKTFEVYVRSKTDLAG